jgi:choline dehydrogenase-like flavoprotein
VTPVVLGREQTEDLSLACDVVVVGSGASGAVVATELAAAGQEVVVLEEGPHVPPEAYGKMRPSETLRHMWRDGGTSFAIGLGDSPVINVMMGRCIGGSSVLTGGVCFRIPDDVLAEWVREHGLTEMTPKGMEPCFEAVERAMHVETVPESMRSRSTKLFANGARKLGFELSPIRRNTVGCNGCGRCNFGCPHGAKQSVDISYLPRARASGARLYSDCLAEEILLNGERAVGVRGRFLDGPRARKGPSFTVRARRVVVACGGYHSPLLLRRSGIGRRSGQVGRNLTLHPSFRVMARYDERVEGWKGALQSAWSDRFHEDRITLTGLFVPPGALAGTMPGIGAAHVARARALPHMAVFGGLIHDTGSGVVRRGLGREPIVTYRMSKQDRASVPILMRRMAEVFFAGGAREVFLPILGSHGVKPDDLATLDLSRIPASRLECGSQHPLGTCRMGTSPYRSVVKPDGETWDVRDLYVVDGSVLPSSLGVNPQVSVMAVATKLAWGMREKPLVG